MIKLLFVTLAIEQNRKNFNIPIVTPMLLVLSLWRGEALESFNPSRVIRQGDPISPYLFVLCMERLSQMINVAVDSNLWKPIQLGRKGPKLSHLVFVDDLILYVEAFMNQVEIVNACLHFFCESLGEKASKEKTSFFF